MNALVIETLRTPAGRRGGALSGVHPVDLLASVLREALVRAGIEAAAVDDVICGCVSQVGEQSLNVARSAALAAGFPASVPGVTVDRQCGSSQQALAFAAHGIASGAYECVIACGVESMSRVPLGATYLHGPGERFGPELLSRFALVDQGESAERVAEQWNLSREDLDAYALRSHRRAAAARDAGRFAPSLLATAGLAFDEGIRDDTSLERLAALKPAFRTGGRITAGNASQISDGAAAVVLASEAFAKRYNLRQRARIVADVAVGDDPVLMLTATIPATSRVLERAGLTLEDIALVEINEAFASVVLAWASSTGYDAARTNVNGGAIALGHPLGATGARLTTILVDELERRGERYGLQVMCEGGGLANATIVERLER